MGNVASAPEDMSCPMCASCPMVAPIGLDYLLDSNGVEGIKAVPSDGTSSVGAVLFQAWCRFHEDHLRPAPMPAKEEEARGSLKSCAQKKRDSQDSVAAGLSEATTASGGESDDGDDSSTDQEYEIGIPEKQEQQASSAIGRARIESEAAEEVEKVRAGSPAGWDSEVWCNLMQAGSRAAWLMRHRGMTEHEAQLQVMHEFPSRFNRSRKSSTGSVTGCLQDLPPQEDLDGEKHPLVQFLAWIASPKPALEAAAPAPVLPAPARPFLPSTGSIHGGVGRFGGLLKHAVQVEVQHHECVEASAEGKTRDLKSPWAAFAAGLAESTASGGESSLSDDGSDFGERQRNCTLDSLPETNESGEDLQVEDKLECADEKRKAGRSPLIAWKKSKKSADVDAFLLKEHYLPESLSPNMKKTGDKQDKCVVQ